MSQSIFIVGAVRTPIGKFGGTLQSMSAPELGAVAATEAIRRAGVPANEIDTAILGHGRQAGAGPNPARQVGHRAGLRYESPAYTVNQACASGLRAIVNAAQEILLGESTAVLAGGMESMSNTPYFLPRARWGYRMGHGEIVDGMYRDGFMCPLCHELMGATAENLADQYSITRAEQDEYAVETQRRAEVARAEGRFDAEMIPVEITGRKGTITLTHDEHARDGVTVEALAKLAPVFRDNGTVHAGNASGVTDGAAAMLVVNEEVLRRHDVEPQGRLVAWAQAGVDPSIMGIGPVPAVHKLLDKTGLKLSDIDLIELNEAFAAQAIAVVRELGLDMDRVNVNGGAIALGHPIGCTGARIVTTLLYEMKRRGLKRGLATLCVSGGMGMALLFERD